MAMTFMRITFVSAVLQLAGMVSADCGAPGKDEKSAIRNVAAANLAEEFEKNADAARITYKGSKSDKLRLVLTGTIDVVNNDKESLIVKHVILKGTVKTKVSVSVTDPAEAAKIAGFKKGEQIEFRIESNSPPLYDNSNIGIKDVVFLDAVGVKKLNEKK